MPPAVRLVEKREIGSQRKYPPLRDVGVAVASLLHLLQAFEALLSGGIADLPSLVASDSRQERTRDDLTQGGIVAREIRHLIPVIHLLDGLDIRFSELGRPRTGL